MKECRFHADVGTIAVMCRRVHKGIDAIATLVLDHDDVARIDGTIESVYIPPSKIGCYDACDSNILMGEIEPLQIGAFQVECELVGRILFARIDNAVECKGGRGRG